MSQVVLKTPFSEDIPLAFVYNNTITQQSEYCGSYLQTILHYAAYKMYELDIDVRYDLTKSDIRADIIAGLYNISLHGVSMKANDKTLQYSYPLELLRSCIMVPLAPELPKYMYIIWPFGRFIWTSLFLGIFYVTLLMSFLELKKQSFGVLLQRNFLKSIAILSFTANMNLKLTKTSTREKIFYFLLLTLGFILSSYHTSHMTAYCMKPIFIKPISSLSDLFESKLKVIITTNLYNEFNSRKSVDLTFLEAVLEKRSQHDFQAVLKKFNRSVGYVVTQHQWNFLNNQQRKLVQPYFRLTNICFESLLNAFPMHLNATFTDSLNMWILNVQESGLWLHWQKNAFHAAISAKFAKYLWDTYPVEPLNCDFFRVGWIVFGVGITVSCIALLIEYFFYKRNVGTSHHHLN